MSIIEEVNATALWVGLGSLSLSTSVGVYFWAFWRKKAMILETLYDEEINKQRDINHSQKIVLEESELGLHIVKHEVDRHQATISVESRDGKGTTFSIEFPMISDPKGANLK